MNCLNDCIGSRIETLVLHEYNELCHSTVVTKLLESLYCKHMAITAEDLTENEVQVSSYI